MSCMIDYDWVSRKCGEMFPQIIRDFQFRALFNNKHNCVLFQKGELKNSSKIFLGILYCVLTEKVNYVHWIVNFFSFPEKATANSLPVNRLIDRQKHRKIFEVKRLMSTFMCNSKNSGSFLSLYFNYWGSYRKIKSINSDELKWIA